MENGSPGEGTDVQMVRKLELTINKWEKVSLLGSGSFGSVYKGISDKGSFLAVKEVSLLDQGSLGRQRVSQLEQEIALLRLFEHENIVQYYGTQKDESNLYIFLELVTEGSLQKLYEVYPLADSHVSVYTRQILQGLKYLHDRKVIHRDIKCANILVHANGSVKLADFGLAKTIQRNDIKSCQGTAYWMAPEVVHSNSQGYGLPADIWSLGCTVLEMLTGLVPYHNFEWMAALWRIGKGELPLVPDSLSSEARDFINKCLQVEPDKRPTAAELLNHPFVNKPHLLDRHEVSFINEIVKVSKRTHLDVAKYPVGIEPRVQEMLKLLDVEGSDVRMVGIWGMGGIGKTTIAKAVYNDIAHEFEGCCFLGNVRESVHRRGLVGLQNMLLSEILGKTQEMKLTNVNKGIDVIKKRLGSKRVLLVLDDVSDLSQLDNLVGDSNWLGRGSRIIITTRDKRTLVAHKVHQIYEARVLDNDEACKLLSLNAFKENRNPGEFPINMLVGYTRGLPLAINILGSLLCGKRIDQWQAALDNYKRFSKSDVLKILETSYIALEYPLREAFLDIACLLKGSHKSFVMQVLEGSGLINPLRAIKQLEAKAFIYTNEDGRIWMHDLLEIMGKEIVRRESPNDPCRRSRLWFHEDVCRVLTENTGTAEIKGILVKLPKEGEICLGAECFEKMPNLEIFININARFVGEGIRYLPNKLRRDLPLMFESDPQKLVVLDITNSTNSRLFQGSEKYHNLKDISISSCESLAEFLVLPGMFPKVESLRLSRCSNLVEFPRIVHMKSLKYLYVGNCERLENFLEIGGRMESLISLKISRTAIKQIPSSIGYDLVNLELFFVTECENLSYLPRSLYNLQHTKELFVFQCPEMILLEEKIPTLANSNEISLDNYYGPLSITKSDGDQGNLLLPSVCEIWLSGTAIVTLPVVFSEFGQVTKLELVNCLMLQEISELPPNLKKLDVSGCISLESILKLSKILKREESQMLEILNSSNCHRLWGNLVHEAEKQGWLVNGQVEADDMSLFLLSQQSAFVVIFPRIEVPKWFGCEMAYQGSRVFEFYIDILPNFDWENTGLAVCLVTGEEEAKAFSWAKWEYKLKMYIKEVEVKSICGGREFSIFESMSSSAEVCLCYIPFKGIDMSQLGQIRPLPPFQCRVSIHLDDNFSRAIKSFGVHLVMPPKKNVCMKLSHGPISSRNPDDTELSSDRDSQYSDSDSQNSDSHSHLPD